MPTSISDNQPSFIEGGPPPITTTQSCYIPNIGNDIDANWCYISNHQTISDNTLLYMNGTIRVFSTQRCHVSNTDDIQDIDSTQLCYIFGKSLTHYTQSCFIKGHHYDYTPVGEYGEESKQCYIGGPRERRYA